MKRGNNNNLFNSFHNGSGSKSPKSSGGSGSGNSRIPPTIPTQSASLTKSMFRSVPMVDVAQPALPGGFASPPSFLGMGSADAFAAPAPTIPTLDSKSLFASKMMPSLSMPPTAGVATIRTIPPATPITKAPSASVGGSKMDLEAMSSAAASAAPTWKVDQVPEVPMFHKVAWNALHVSTDDIQVTTIVKRISIYLRLQSVAVTFDNEQAKATCTTNAPSLVKFVIRLWQPTTQDATIVEVQKVQGDSLQLQRIKAGLEDAIQCHEEKDIKPPVTPSFETFRAQHDLFQRVLPPPPPPSASIPDTTQENTPSSLRICLDMFQRRTLHEHKLGLETLCHLTDPQHTFHQEVTAVSAHVLQDEDFQEHLQEYLQPVGMSPASLLETPHGFHPAPSIPKPSGPATREGRSQDFYGASMHLLALQALGNALEAVCKDNSSSPELDLSSVFWQTTLGSLRHNLCQAHEHLLEASLSIRCLRHLQILVPSCMATIDDSGDDMIVDSLRMAYLHGCCSSHSLEHESRCCLEGLGIQV